MSLGDLLQCHLIRKPDALTHQQHKIHLKVRHSTPVHRVVVNQYLSICVETQNEKQLWRKMRAKGERRDEAEKASGWQWGEWQLMSKQTRAAWGYGVTAGCKFRVKITLSSLSHTPTHTYRLWLPEAPFPPSSRLSVWAPEALQAFRDTLHKKHTHWLLLLFWELPLCFLTPF